MKKYTRPPYIRIIRVVGIIITAALITIFAIIRNETSLQFSSEETLKSLPYAS